MHYMKVKIGKMFQDASCCIYAEYAVSFNNLIWLTKAVLYWKCMTLMNSDICRVL